jgi:hypothetical protein
MQIVPLAALQEPDERVRRFTPLELSTGGMLSASDAADYQQRAIASIELVEAVPESTRSTFERLRTLHSYGVLCYETRRRYFAAGDTYPSRGPSSAGLNAKGHLSWWETCHFSPSWSSVRLGNAPLTRASVQSCLVATHTSFPTTTSSARGTRRSGSRRPRPVRYWQRRGCRTRWRTHGEGSSPLPGPGVARPDLDRHRRPAGPRRPPGHSVRRPRCGASPSVACGPRKSLRTAQPAARRRQVADA